MAQSCVGPIEFVTFASVGLPNLGLTSRAYTRTPKEDLCPPAASSRPLLQPSLWPWSLTVQVGRSKGPLVTTVRKLAEYLLLSLRALLWVLGMVVLFALGLVLALTVSTRTRRLVLAACASYLVWTGFQRHQQRRVGY